MAIPAGKLFSVARLTCTNATHNLSQGRIFDLFSKPSLSQRRVLQIFHRVSALPLGDGFSQQPSASNRRPDATRSGQARRTRRQLRGHRRQGWTHCHKCFRRSRHQEIHHRNHRHRRRHLRLRQRRLARYFPRQRHYARGYPPRAKPHRIISITTITTEPSPMSPRRPASPTHRLGTRRAASATTTTTDGTISTSLTTAKIASITTRRRNLHRSREKAGVAGNGKAWGTGCAFVDYDRDGHLDLMVANYVDFDIADHACTRRSARVHVEGRARHVRPARLARRKQYPLPQSRRRQVRRRHQKSAASTKPTATTASASPPSTTTTTAGPTSMSPATARPASSITTITTELSPTSRSLPASPSTKTAASKPAWVHHRRLRRRRTPGHLQDQFFRRHLDPLSQQRRRHLRRRHFRRRTRHPHAISWLGHDVFRFRQRRLARHRSSSTATSIPKSTNTISAPSTKSHAFSITTTATARFTDMRCRRSSI